MLGRLLTVASATALLLSNLISPPAQALPSEVSSWTAGRWGQELNLQADYDPRGAFFVSGFGGECKIYFRDWKNNFMLPGQVPELLVIPDSQKGPLGNCPNLEAALTKATGTSYAGFTDEVLKVRAAVDEYHKTRYTGKAWEHVVTVEFKGVKIRGGISAGFRNIHIY